MNNKLAIVVLNYRNFRVTEECINYLLKQEKIDLHIIVVDNGSDNESVDYLSGAYRDNPKVHIIDAGENLGFSRGNNIGIKYARKSLHVDIIGVFNSDIKLLSVDTLYKICSLERDGIGVVTFLCKSPNGVIQPPFRMHKQNFGKDIRRYIVKAIIRYMVIILGLGKIIEKRINKKLSDEPQQNENYDDLLCISGCAYVLMPDYFKSYDGLYDKLFLYGEELVMLVYLFKAGLNTRIVESDIIHLGGASSDINLSEYSKEKAFQSLKSIIKIYSDLVR